MNYSEVESKVKDILADKLNLDKAKINLNSQLLEDLGMDSFATVETMFELEEKFGMKIPDEDISKAKIVKDVVDYLMARMEKK